MDDLISRQVAIDAVDAIGHIATLSDGDEVIRKSAVKYTLSMLPPTQPELSHTQKSCEYCHEDSDGYTRPIEKNCHAYIRFGMNGWELDLKAKGWHGETQIKFCPMCGRELQGG